MGLLEAATNTPWLITPDYLRVILEAITREHLDADLARQIREERAARFEALGMRKGRRLDGTRAVVMRGGVAVIPVVGPIVRHSDFFAEVSGLQSLEAVARDFQVALDSPDVDAVLFDMDTPGGEVTGISELAEAIYAARDQKPVWAYGEGLVASAGYWLGSATERLIVADTAAAGSIGVVLAVRDPTKATARDIEFVSSQSPKKRPDPTTEGGRGEFQRLVDQTAEVFVAAVARNRGVSEDRVLSDFGQGGMLVGKYAVTSGLADKLGTFESALTDITAAAAERRRPATLTRRGSAAMSQEARMPPDEKLTVEELQARLEAAEKREREAAAKAKDAEDRAAAAQARIAEAQGRAVKAAAEKFAADQLGAARTVAAQTPHLVTLYTAVAGDEAALTALTQVFANAPQHKLLGEHLPSADKLTLIPNARGEGGEAAKVEQGREAARRLANKTNGKAAK